MTLYKDLYKKANDRILTDDARQRVMARVKNAEKRNVVPLKKVSQFAALAACFVLTVAALSIYDNFEKQQNTEIPYLTENPATVRSITEPENQEIGKLAENPALSEQTVTANEPTENDVTAIQYEPNPVSSDEPLVAAYSPEDEEEITLPEVTAEITEQTDITVPVTTPAPLSTETPAPTLEAVVPPTEAPVVTDAPTPLVTSAPTTEPTPLVTSAPTTEPTPLVTPSPTAEPTPLVTEAPKARIFVNNTGVPENSTSVAAFSRDRSIGVIKEVTLLDYYQYIGKNIEACVLLPEGFSLITQESAFFELDENENYKSDDWCFIFENADRSVEIITTLNTESISQTIFNEAYQKSTVCENDAVVIMDTDFYRIYMIAGNVGYTISTFGLSEAEISELLISLAE